MDYLIASQKLVEPLYALDTAGKFRVEVGAPATAEGRAFISGRLVTGAEMLSAIWTTAWRSAGPDTYLRTQLLKRQDATNRAATPAAPTKKP